MQIGSFIAENDIDCTKNIVGIETIMEAEEKVGVSFGPELRKYLLTWGYLGFESVEFYGMNSRQNLESDMVSQTLYIHTYFPSTSELIAIESLGDGEYALVDAEDRVFILDTEEQSLMSLERKLFEYMLDRFMNEE